MTKTDQEEMLQEETPLVKMNQERTGQEKTCLEKMVQVKIDEYFRRRKYLIEQGNFKLT